MTKATKETYDSMTEEEYMSMTWQETKEYLLQIYPELALLVEGD